MKCPNSKCEESQHALDAAYCHICGTKLVASSQKHNMCEIDLQILEIIKENSFSKRPLAAYEGRKYANQICKKHFGKAKKNYKEYVEMLMAINYPKELEKANRGKEFLLWLGVSIWLSLTFWGLLISVPLVIWSVIPTYKKLKSMCV